MKTVQERAVRLGIAAAKIAVVAGIIVAGLYNIFMFVKTHDVIAVPKEEREMVEFYLDHPEWGDKNIVEYNETVIGK